MSDSPRANPSQHQSHTARFVAENGWENLPLLSAQSMKQQYTSGKRIPLSHSSSTGPDREAATIPFAEEPVDLATDKTPESPSAWSADQQDGRGLSRRRLGALYNAYNPQMIFENRGSTARDHLSSERTFLAYVRTSLALASAGVALVQLFASSSAQAGEENHHAVHKFARNLGMSTVVMALFVLGIAVYRYFLIQHALPKNMFPVARFSVVFITFVLSAVVVVIFAALLAGR